MNSLSKRAASFAVLITILFTFQVFGCSMSFGGGGSSPQKKPDTSKEEIQNSVKKEMKDPEMRKLIEDAAKTQRLELLLQTPEADRLIQKKIVENLDTPMVNAKIQQDMKKVMTMPDLQKQFQEHVRSSLETPAVKSALISGVQRAVVQMFQGGGGASGGGAGGASGGGTGSMGGGGGGGGGSTSSGGAGGTGTGYGPGGQ